MIIEKKKEIYIITGTSRNDTLYGTSSADRISGMSGNDILYGGAGNDTILGGAGIDILHGEAGNDSLEGGAGGDTLNGNDGNDTLKGDDGNDTLFGGLGKDYLYGGAGNDTLQGKQMGDDLYGGAGNDLYIFNVGDGVDTISDEAGSDTISINGVTKDDIAIFMDSNNSLHIDYDTTAETTDTIEILNQNTNTIENIIVGDYMLTSTTINQLIQDMSAYATENGITISSIEDVKANADLINMISNAWTDAA